MMERRSLCAPPRLYNPIAVQIADQKKIRWIIEFARMLALVNVAYGRRLLWYLGFEILL